MLGSPAYELYSSNTDAVFWKVSGQQQKKVVMMEAALVDDQSNESCEQDFPLHRCSRLKANQIFFPIGSLNRI